MQQYDIQGLFEKCVNRSVETHDKELLDSIQRVIDFGEKQKGVLAVVTTGLIYKYYHPEQDVRMHQSALEGGYSGRTFDTKHITPFLRRNDFPSMAESGWLTRSLEQKTPYDFNYTGSISGKDLKEAFLKIYDATQTKSVIDMLSALFKGLVEKRDQTKIDLSTPANLTVSETLNLMENHFNYEYKNVSGAARLPHLAIYSAYKTIIESSQGKYKGKIICDLDSHTASDKSTGSIGDIQINTDAGEPYEGLEIKAKKIEPSMVDIVYGKIQEYSTVERYYILSTFDDMSDEVKDEVTEKVNKIRSKHGCEVIINGVFTTLKCFLRLTDSKLFLKNYVDQMVLDDALKYEHKKAWSDLCSDL